MKLLLLLATLKGVLSAKIKYGKEDSNLTNDCPAGYAKTAFTGSACMDIDECGSRSHNCPNGNKCINTPGSFKCACAVGYSGSLPTCTDVNECAVGTHSCRKWGYNCSNTQGSFQCVCATGTVGTVLSSGLNCTNQNECSAGTHNCHPMANCTDTEGSFTCVCKKGYLGDGKTCADYDQCIFGNHNCHKNAACVDTPGSFLCTCNTGYAGNGTTCLDIDECASPVKPCNTVTGACHNSPGSFICACKPGYSGNGKECANINECTQRVNACQPNANCTDTEGSYNCDCQPGFTNLSTPLGACVDIDECAKNLADIALQPGIPTICHVAANCTNTLGSFSCKCKAGYQDLHSTAGTNCSNVDECASGTHNCDNHANCVDTDGSFTCKCKAGFNGTGTRFSGAWPPTDGCWDIDECTTAKIWNRKVCAANGSGSVCTNSVGSFACTCATGFAGDGMNCKNIDECTSQRHRCAAESTNCIDTPGSYICACRPGFVLNGIGQCTSAKSIEVGVFQKKTVEWEQVKFESAFKTIPVVTINLPLPGHREFTARVKDVSITGFKVAVSFLASANGTADQVYVNWTNANLPPLNYMAVAPGVNQLPNGQYVTAGFALSIGQMERSSACTQPAMAYWTNVTFLNNYLKPTVLAQINGMADPYWRGGPLSAADFCAAGVRVNAAANESANLNNSAQVARICHQTVGWAMPKSGEQIGWIALGHNISSFLYATPKGNRTVKFSSVALNETLGGAARAEVAAYGQNFAHAPIVLANKVTRTRHVIGWMHFEGALTDKATYKVEETDGCAILANRSDYLNMFAASESFSV